MKEVKYNGRLSEDVETARNDGKINDLIISGLITDFLSIVLSLPVVYLLNRLFKAETNWAVSIITVTVVDTISTIMQIKKSIRKREKNVNESKICLSRLTDKLNYSEELTDKYSNNQMPTIRVQDVIDSVTTKEKTVEKNATYDETDNVAKSIKTIVTDFYMLDSEDQLKVLREVRRKIKTDDDKIYETNLYLLENEDIPSVLPIKRTLERK